MRLAVQDVPGTSVLVLVLVYAVVSCDLCCHGQGIWNPCMYFKNEVCSVMYTGKFGKNDLDFGHLNLQIPRDTCDMSYSRN